MSSSPDGNHAAASITDAPPPPVPPAPMAKAQVKGFTGRIAGKEARAREARAMGAAAWAATGNNVGACASAGGRFHRAAGGAPRMSQVPPIQRPIVAFLEDVEARARRAARPRMLQRAVIPKDCHGALEPACQEKAKNLERVNELIEKGAERTKDEDDELRRRINVRDRLALGPGYSDGDDCSGGPRHYSLRAAGLRGWDRTGHLRHERITSLDLSRNELFALPGIECLAHCLASLNICRNFFAELPAELAALTRLERLDASYNTLRGSEEALRVASLGRHVGS